MNVKFIIVNYTGEAGAALNRCRCLAAGLREKKVKCDIVPLTSKYQSKIPLAFHYLSFLIRLLVKSKNEDILIFYGDFPLLNIVKLFKNKNALVIGERNEYPTHVIRGKSQKDSYLENMSFFDGYITCTNNLEKYYKEFTNRNCPYKIIPCVVEIAKFIGNEKVPKNNFVTYCGDIGNNKDGVPDLIKAFFSFSKEFPEYKLRIIGDTKDVNGKNEIINIIKELEINDSVIMEGRVPQNQISRMLCESKILVLARPNNKQAEGGFASKVCEYLATGVPSLITETGELNDYFQHNENIFFSAPDNPEHFSKMLKEIASNYSHSLEVAKKGKEVNMQFDYTYQSNELLIFLTELMKSKQ